VTTKGNGSLQNNHLEDRKKDGEIKQEDIP
jgi:hypothetical protein